MTVAINTDLLAAVRGKILAVPEAYDQNTFGSEADTPCGTRACIAGHALILAGLRSAAEINDRFDDYLDEKFDVPAEAARALGLSRGEAGVLFAFGDDWPEPYGPAFTVAETDAERARVAADYLDHIIKTGNVFAD